MFGLVNARELFSSNIATQQSRRRDMATAVGVAVVGALVAWWYTSAGLAATEDSALYWAAAEHLNDGYGLTTPFVNRNSHLALVDQFTAAGRIPFTEYQPGYPALIAVGVFLGLGTAASAHLLAIAAAAVICAATFLIARRVLKLSLFWSLIVSALVFIRPDREYQFGGLSYVLAEFTYVAVTLVVVGLALQVTAKRVRHSVVIICVLVAGLSLIRPDGMVIGAALAVGLALSPPHETSGPRHRRWLRLTAVAVAGPLSVGAWMGVNRAFLGATSEVRTVAWHPDGESLLTMIYTMGGWFGLSTDLPFRLISVVVAVGVVTPLVVTSVPAFRRWLWPGAGAKMTLAVVASAVMIGQCILIILLGFVGDSSVSPDPRHLTVAQVFCYLAIAAVVSAAASKLSMHLKHPSVSVLGQLSLLAVCVGITVPTFTHLDKARQAAQLHASGPKNLLSLKGVGDDTLLVTNVPAFVWQATGHGSLLLPPPEFLTDGLPNSAYQSDLDAIVNLATQRKVIVAVDRVWSPHPALNGQDAIAALAEKAEFSPAAQCPGGLTLWTLTGSAAAQEAQSLCPDT